VIKLPWQQARGWKGLIAVLLAGAAALAGCGAEPDTPEQQVRALLGRAETLAETRDLDGLKALISERYRDPAKHDRRGIVQILAYYFFRHKTIYLLVKVDRLEVVAEGRAEATVFVAMAATPVDAQEQLLNLRADLYRFDVVVEEERKGDWKLMSAEWRRIQKADFIGNDA